MGTPHLKPVAQRCGKLGIHYLWLTSETGSGEVSCGTQHLTCRVCANSRQLVSELN